MGAVWTNRKMQQMHPGILFLQYDRKLRQKCSTKVTSELQLAKWIISNALTQNYMSYRWEFTIETVCNCTFCMVFVLRKNEYVCFSWMRITLAVYLNVDVNWPLKIMKVLVVLKLFLKTNILIVAFNEITLWTMGTPLILSLYLQLRLIQ